MLYDSSNDFAAIRADGQFGPTLGYLGAQGYTEYDGILSANWSGSEIGAIGISTGGSTTDNYGVMGHSNGVGVRGEYSDNPTSDFGELGAPGIGIRASGSTWAGDFNGAVDISGNLSVATAYTTHRLVVESGDAETMRLIGPNSFGYGARLNLGDSDYVYIDEPVDDDMEIHASDVTVSGNFTVTGAKNFLQPHPSDPTKAIRFTCLEGNESGTYFRGSARLFDGVAEIEVPEVFRLASEREGLTVQLTARGPRADLWVETKDLNTIIVRGAYDVEFDYFVNGVRRGFANLPTIVDNKSIKPQVRDVPFAPEMPADYRQILVGNKILNPDFTPNETTARRMGWKLRDPEAHESASGKILALYREAGDAEERRADLPPSVLAPGETE